MAQVRTAYGLIDGAVSTDGKVFSFRGVPFAQPPVGPLRWKPPQRPKSWDSVRPCTQFGPACIQGATPDDSLVYGNERDTSEDCLYLNVYTAGLNDGEKRPVIVWFHHGGFMMGWGSAPLYDGTNLARAGAVVVTVNYRLGRLGFMAHPALTAESDHHASGNYGLMDQIAALQWVQENIVSFGGDPDCVTIYGVSAGSFSVSVHMASPLSEGLFHRAIGGSGASFGPVSDTSEAADCFQTLESAERTCAALMAGVGARTADELRALSAEAILAAKSPEFWLARPGLLDTTYPIIDGYLLPQLPYDQFVQRRQNNVPLMTGSNRHESSITPFNMDTDTYLADSRVFLGPFFDRFIALFPAGPDGQTTRSSMAATSDRIFTWQNWQWARLQAQYGTSPVYYYNFTHEPPVPDDSVAEQKLNPRVGAFHSAEIPYVFRNLEKRDWPWSEADRALSATMSGYWLDFARTGNPNGAGRPLWPSFDNATRGMMQFDSSAAATTAPQTERLAFWDEVYAWKRAGQPKN